MEEEDDGTGKTGANKIEVQHFMIGNFQGKSGNTEGSRNPWVIKFHGRLGC